MNNPISGKPSFNPLIPEIYAIEVASACDLECPGCIREKIEFARPSSLMTVELARTISERDLGGSYFIEFQQSGEPTLNKKLGDIISLFTGKVLTGLSTHGQHIHRCVDALLQLDYLTISVDSLSNYEQFRTGGKLDILLDNIDLLLKKRGNKKTPVVDLQIIEWKDWQKEFDDLSNLCAKNNWRVTIRSIGDCMEGMRERRQVLTQDMCLNPWLSCNIHSDGDVVPCCFAFGKALVYGNVKDQPLETIWKESETVKMLRSVHSSGNIPDSIPCSKCYLRSPVVFHQTLYNKTVNEIVFTKK